MMNLQEWIDRRQRGELTIAQRLECFLWRNWWVVRALPLAWLCRAAFGRRRQENTDCIYNGARGYWHRGAYGWTVRLGRLAVERNSNLGGLSARLK